MYIINSQFLYCCTSQPKTFKQSITVNSSTNALITKNNSCTLCVPMLMMRMLIGKFAITTLWLKNAKQRYYSDPIEDCGGDTRKLFQIVRFLSNKPEENQLPPHNDPCKLADDFGEFFLPES